MLTSLYCTCEPLLIIVTMNYGFIKFHVGEDPMALLLEFFLASWMTRYVGFIDFLQDANSTGCYRARVATRSALFHWVAKIACVSFWRSYAFHYRILQVAYELLWHRFFCQNYG